ncbi:hypothetical protein Tco_1211655 [Tanacetum coccineum]
MSSIEYRTDVALEASPLKESFQSPLSTFTRGSFITSESHYSSSTVVLQLTHPRRRYQISVLSLYLSSFAFRSLVLFSSLICLSNSSWESGPSGVVKGLSFGALGLDPPSS